MNLEKHYGEWNAVCVNGEWRFVDVLWGACDLKDPGDGRGRFQYDERLFLTDPKDLIYTHFAEASPWQLLDSPRTLEVFQESVCLKTRFFDFEMQVLSHPVCEIQSEDGEIDIMFGVKPEKTSLQRFNCYISYFDRPDTKQKLSKGTEASLPVFIHKPTESSVSFKLRFPDRGIFRIDVVGKEISKDSLYRQYDWVAEYKVTVEDSALRGFPKMDTVGWGPGKDMNKIGLAPFNYTSGIIVAKNVQTKIRFKIIDTHVVQNMKFFFKIKSTQGNELQVNSVADTFEIDLNIMTFFIEAPPHGEYTLKMYARNVRGKVEADQRMEINVCNYLLICDVQQPGSPLGILKERTEIVDDRLEPERLRLSPTVQRPKSDVSIGGPSVTESVVSASSVVMDTGSQVTESVPNSPVMADQDIRQKASIPMEQISPKPEEASTKIPATLVVSKMKTNEQTTSRKSEMKPDVKQKQQEFVRVEGDLQDIPEIPLNVVKPVVANLEVERSKREMKVVSTNRVVPLKMTGGNDGSIMLVPADDKPNRPATGVKRVARQSSNTKYFTTMAHANSEQK